MTTCSQLMDIDSLVAGELEPPHAVLLRAHAAGCAACRAEMSLVTAERALFAHRAEAMPGPPVVSLPEMRRIVVRSLQTNHGPALAKLLRRGHFTAACAAALFMVAAFSRPGRATRADVPSVLADGEAAPSGMLASIADEPLACSSGGGVASSFASMVSEDLGIATTTTTSAPLASLGHRDRVLACETRARSQADCEPYVTCSSLRQ